MFLHIKKHALFYGAGDEARTRYLHLGKVALYRMSYTRGTRWIIAQKTNLSTPKAINILKGVVYKRLLLKYL